jgi:hypothetical protein
LTRADNLWYYTKRKFLRLLQCGDRYFRSTINPRQVCHVNLAE